MYKIRKLNDQSYLCKFNDINKYLYNITEVRENILKRLYLIMLRKLITMKRLKKFS